MKAENKVPQYRIAVAGNVNSGEFYNSKLKQFIPYSLLFFLLKIFNYLIIHYNHTHTHTYPGKSTLVGVITKGKLDNSLGSIRNLVFQHNHEFESGRTSSITTHSIYFDHEGNVLNTSDYTNIASVNLSEKRWYFYCYSYLLLLLLILLKY